MQWVSRIFIFSTQKFRGIKNLEAKAAAVQPSG
jgi:hypothetical protein